MATFSRNWLLKYTSIGSLYFSKGYSIRVLSYFDNVFLIVNELLAKAKLGRLALWIVWEAVKANEILTMQFTF